MTRLRYILLLVLVLPFPLLAQTGSLTGVALDNVGNTVAGATITACTLGSPGIPCAPVTASTTSNGQGAFSMVVPVGTYTVTVFRLGVVATSSTVVVAPSNITVANTVTYTGNVTIGPGNLTVSGTVTVNTYQGLPIVGGATYPCTAAGINAAIAASPAIGGIVDATGCQGGITGQTTTVTVGSSTQAITLKLGSYTYSGTANPLFLVHPRSNLSTTIGTIISQISTSANAVILAGTGTPAANSGGIDGPGLIQCGGATGTGVGLIVGGSSDTGNLTGNAANFAHVGPITITACGNAEKYGNNVFIFKHDHIQYFGNGGTTGANTIFAPSGITLSNENISYVGGQITGPNAGTVSATCVNLQAGNEFAFQDTSFDNCGMTTNAPGGNLEITDSHMEFGFSTTVDFITTGATCNPCTVTIKGTQFREDVASARTEFFALTGTTHFSVFGGYHVAAETVAQMVNVTGANSQVYLVGWNNSNGNFTTGVAGAGLVQGLDCSNTLCRTLSGFTLQGVTTIAGAPGINPAMKFVEAFAPPGATGNDILYSDATTHGMALNYNNGGYSNLIPKTTVLTADWTCGTGGTVASCTSATIIGSGGGVPLTIPLPLVASSMTLVCDGVVGQATAATANQWNLLTATNGATNVTATYSMATAATASAYGAVTDQASTTTTFQIAPSWTLGGTATKMPFHIWAKIEGASASGTVLSLQLLAPTVGDLVTIYRGTSCSIY